MTIRVRFTSLDHSDAVLEHVRRRATSAFGRLGARVGPLVVSLGDVNGPRGGRDKRCTVRVRLPGRGSIVVRETAHDLYAAVDRGLRRAAFAVTRWADRGPRGGRWTPAPLRSA
ncbi:MAG: HPF/RaiA family ribosome-associated protein [Vicinamibacterales bacterium]